MTGTERKSACTVRVTVKMRPDEYDKLFRHVCEIGSTMSAFFRESAATAMKEKLPTWRSDTRRQDARLEQPGGSRCETSSERPADFAVPTRKAATEIHGHIGR